MAMTVLQRAQINRADVDTDIEEVGNVPWDQGGTDTGIRFRYEDSLGRVARACPVVPRAWFLNGEIFAAQHVHSDAERLEIAGENLAAYLRSRGANIEAVNGILETVQRALSREGRLGVTNTSRYRRPMSITKRFFEDAQHRRGRFAKLFDTLDTLDQQTVRLLELHAERLKPGRSERLTVAAFLFGKAGKSSDAIAALCELGLGEDAIILVRSQLNLAINFAYICRGGNADELAHQFVAHGMLTHKKLRDRLIADLPPEEQPRQGPFPGGDKTEAEWRDIKSLSTKWTDISIERRADAAGLRSIYDFYKYASSPEHSDAWSSVTYLDDSDKGLKVTNAPSDALVDLALGIAAWSLALVTTLFFEQFGIVDDPEVAKLMQAVNELLQQMMVVKTL